MPIAPQHETPKIDATEVVKAVVGNHVKNAAAGSHTIIFLDWDDTLLCSNVLSKQGIKLDTSMEGRTQLMRELDQLSGFVINVLETAMRHGEVHIVTNGETGWVELSCKKFLPRVEPYLTKVRVLSARSTYEHMFPDNPMKWKLQAFSHSLAPLYHSDEYAGVEKNILSFGDSHAEREAIRTVTNGLPYTRTKSIKFAERPTIEQLERQLELVVNCFDYIYGHNEDLDLCMSLSVAPAPKPAGGKASDAESAPAPSDVASCSDKNAESKQAA